MTCRVAVVAMPQPEVSVVIPVHDAMPYLVTCLSSVFEQSIGRDGLEVVAVENGSTDGSAEMLDVLARTWPGLRVAHEARPIGPSRSRNIGIELASGRYVFFLDADDYLGREGLERLVAMADDWGSDIVLGRHRGADGRDVDGIAEAHFKVSRSHVDGRSLFHRIHCQHLFRHDFLTRHALRFPEQVHVGEDYLFVIPACCHASVVSVVGDYDCYYLRQRADGRNISNRLVAPHYSLTAVEHALPLVRQYVDPGPRREYMVGRGLVQLSRLTFGDHFLECDDAERDDVVRRARALVTTWSSPGVLDRLAAPDRRKLRLVEQGRTAELAEVVRALRDEE